MSAIDLTACMNEFIREFDDRSISRRVALRDSYIREIQPFINKKVELRALAPKVYTITQTRALITSGPQLSEEMERHDRMLDEMIAHIGRCYEREMMRCFVDVARPGTDMTVAYRMDVHGERPRLTPLSASQLYKQCDHASCRQCGQVSEHFFTSQRDQTSLCEKCFGDRESKQLAKEVTKTRHPLDAWME